MKTRSKALLTAAVAVPMVLGGVGTAYAAHYQDRALPGSTISGLPVSGLTRAQVAEAVQQRADAVTVEVSSGDTTTSEHLADLGYTVDVDATADAIFAANAKWSSYATSLVSSRDVAAVVRTDPERVEAVTAALVEQADKVGRNAAVKLAKGKASFDVRPAASGHSVAPESFQDVVAAAAQDLTSASTTVEFVEMRPTVTTAAAEKVAKKANSIITRTLAVSDGSAEHSPDAETKASWISIPVEDEVPGAPVVDADKVTAWVEGVAKDLATEPTNGMRNVSSAGDVLSVVTQASDGRSVANAESVATAAVKAMTAAKKYTGDFSYDAVPATWTDRTIAVGAEKLAYPATDGEKWIDVDLSEHTMTAYVGAKVVKGPIAMVNGSAEKPTVTGLFHVYYKNPLMTMRGSNADGTDYETEDVPWSSFFIRGFALHGAPWRDSFGYAASHGCINLPVPVAKWVYDFAPIGTPVASHH